MENRIIIVSNYMKLLAAFIALNLVVSCLDPIDLEIPKGTGEAIVINAKIVYGSPSEFTLSLGQIFSFTTDSKGRIIAKNVVLADEEGNEMEIDPTADSEYFYRFQDSDPIKIEIGSSYRISVEMFDGRLFESSFEPLLPVPEIESLDYKITEKTFLLPDQSERTRTFVDYIINTQLSVDGSNTPSFLKWEFERVFKVSDSPIVPGQAQKVCYVSGDAGVFNINIFSGEASTTTELNDFLIYEEFLERTYGEGLYFTVIQESLSKEAFEYWQKVSNVLERKDNIYADPPGKIESNYTHVNGDEEVFGYFYLTVQDTARIYVDPELSGIGETRCPSEGLINMDGSCGDPLCCDCASVDNSTTIKPFYWVE